MDEQIENAEKLRISLLRILTSNNLKLFGCILYNFKIEMRNSEPLFKSIREQLEKSNKLSKSVDAVIDLVSQQLTAFATFQNGKPYIALYDSFITTKTINELIFVILHEILHVLDGHHHRCGSRDPLMYNLAADHVINTTLKKDVDSGDLKKVSVPEDCFIIPELKSKPNMTTLEVYEYLMKNSQTKKQQSLSIPGIGSPDDGGDSGNTEMDIVEVSINGKDKTIIKDIIASQNNTKEEVSESTEELISEVRTLMNSDESNRGFASGALKDFIEKIIEVEIPWDKLLERVILTKIVPCPDNRVWTRPLKRLRAHKILLPGPGTARKASVACIVIDTSGSISKTNLQRFTSIVLQSLTYFDEIWIMKHDYTIHQNVRIKTSEVNNDDFIFEYKGRGGTSHKDIFKEIEKSVVEKRDQLGIVIMLTDFESDIESLWDNYKWVNKVPVSIVLTKKISVPKNIDPYPILIKDNK